MAALDIPPLLFTSNIFAEHCKPIIWDCLSRKLYETKVRFCHWNDFLCDSLRSTDVYYNTDDFRQYGFLRFPSIVRWKRIFGFYFYFSTDFGPRHISFIIQFFFCNSFSYGYVCSCCFVWLYVGQDRLENKNMTTFQLNKFRDFVSVHRNWVELKTSCIAKLIAKRSSRQDKRNHQFFSDLNCWQKKNKFKWIKTKRKRTNFALKCNAEKKKKLI